MNWKTLFGLSLLPMIYMIYKAEAGLYGIDAGKEIVLAAGWWGLLYLTLTLSATPLMRIFKKRWLMQHRRQLGLWTMFYSALHMAFYLLFLLESFSSFFEDLLKRPYIALGALSMVILIALSVTSTKGWQKRLKANWLKLHKLVYVVAILVIVHYWMTLRSDYGDWLLWTGPLMVLLGWRLYKKFAK